MLPDEGKTKEQLINELAGLRQRVAELKSSETERKQAERQLKESESFLDSIIQQSPFSTWISDDKGTNIKQNKACRELFGIKKDEEVIGKYNVFKDEEARRQGFMPLIEEVFSKGKTVNLAIDYDFRKVKHVKVPEATHKILDITIFPIKDANGKVTNAVVQHKDITERKRAEDALQQQNEFLNTVLESLTHPFYVVDANDYTIKIANSATKADDLSANPTCYALIHKRDKPCGHMEHPCPLEEVKKTKKPVAVEHIHYDEDGNARNVEVYGYPVFDTEGNVIQIIEYCLDITERKQAEEKYQDLIQKEKDIIYTLDDKGNITFSNPAVETLLGYRREELMGKNFMVLIPKEWQEKTGADFLNLLKTGEITAETVLLDKEGQPHFVEYSSTTIKEGDKIVGTRGIVRDITERKRAEEALRESEEKSRHLVEALQEGIWVIDKDANTTYVNQPMADMLGYSREDMQGKHLFTFMDENGRENAASRLKKRQKGIKEQHDFEFIRKDGERVFTTIVTAPLIDDKGEYAGAIAGIIDITERKRAEEALRESEENYRELAESISDVFFAFDDELRYTYWNKASEELTGISAEDALGKHLYDLFPDTKATRRAGEVYLKVLRTRQPQHFIHEYQLGGKDFFFEISAYPSKQGLSVFTKDITERKRAEETLSKSEKQASAAIEAARALTFNYDIATGKIEWGGAIEEITGYTREELAEIDIEGWANRIHPDDRDEVLSILQEAMGKDRATAEYRFETKKGYVTLSSISLTEKQDGKAIRLVGILQDITERKKAEEEIARLAKFPSENPNPVMRITQNGTVLYANKASLPLLGVWGCQVGQLLPDYLSQSILKVLGSGLSKYIEVECGEQIFSFMFAPVVEAGYVNLYGRDITERKQAEEKEKKLQQELYLSSRLAAIGELAAGVAHEINNPLTGILGFSQRLLRKSTDQEVSQGLEIIHSEALRAAKVVGNLLTFARRREPKKEYSDINEILGRTLELRAYELTMSNINVVTDLAPSLPRTIADFQQIEEVFLNIIMNAEQVMTEANRGGKLTIKTREITGNITVSFTDNGPGIPAEHLDKVFDPFFTTKEEGGGTGLGLSICHGIVVEHGGRIYARSKPGKGATFIVELPIVTEEVDRSKIVDA